MHLLCASYMQERTSAAKRLCGVYALLVHVRLSMHFISAAYAIQVMKRLRQMTRQAVVIIRLMLTMKRQKVMMTKPSVMMYHWQSQLRTHATHQVPQTMM